MKNAELYDKIIAEIEFNIESKLHDKKESRIDFVKNIFERGLALGESKGYRKCEDDFNKQGMYLDEEEADNN